MNKKSRSHLLYQSRTENDGQSERRLSETLRCSTMLDSLRFDLEIEDGRLKRRRGEEKGTVRLCDLETEWEITPSLRGDLNSYAFDIFNQFQFRRELEERDVRRGNREN